MSVTLEPPLTRSGVTLAGRNIDWGTPLTEGPRYVRTPAGSRWHRPRSGVHRNGGNSYGLWCGQYARHDQLLTTDQLPAGEPLCGTCQGRAVGAGQDTWPSAANPLVFSPMRLTPPKRCPGSRTDWCEELGNNVARCLTCGAYAALRASGGPYNPRWGLVNHPPGDHLVPGCPFHAWRELGLVDGRVRCLCKHGEATAT